MGLRVIFMKDNAVTKKSSFFMRRQREVPVAERNLRTAKEYEVPFRAVPLKLWL